jgi:hypothetical protein
MQLACTAHAAHTHTARRARDTAHTKRATRHGSGPLRGTRFGSGSLFGVYDTRNFGKFLCCVPRHPQCEKSYVCPGCRALRCRTALPRTTAHCFRACMLARARGRALPAPPRRTRKRTRRRGPDRSTPIRAKTVPRGDARRVAAAWQQGPTGGGLRGRFPHALQQMPQSLEAYKYLKQARRRRPDPA